MALALLTACEKESKNPTVELLNGSFMNGNATIQPGGAISVKWKVRKGKADLISFTIRLDGMDMPGYPETEIPTGEYLDSTYLEGPITSGDYAYAFLATDADGNIGDKAIVITVE